MTKVLASKLLAVCSKTGLKVVQQPSQYRVEGTDGRRFYIPGTKSVHKVELSGWSHELAVTWESVFPGKKAPSGKITHVVDFSKTEKEILRAFYKMAKAIAPKAPASSPSKSEVEQVLNAALSAGVTPAAIAEQLGS